jgi:hypothetical protein
MYKFFALFQLENLKQMVKRFPISVVLVVTITLIFFFLNNWGILYDDSMMVALHKSIATLILVFFFSI